MKKKSLNNFLFSNLVVCLYNLYMYEHMNFDFVIMK